MGWGPEPGKGGQKKAKTPPLVVVPQRTPNRKRKMFFSISSRRLFESVDGLDSSLAPSAGELWSCKNLQTWVKKVARAGRKGFEKFP